MSRKEGRRELASIEDCVEVLIRRLKNYTKRAKKFHLLVTAEAKHKSPQKLENKNEKRNNCMNIWSVKQRRLHKREDLNKRNLNKETESLLLETQNNAIKIDHIKTKIDYTYQNSKCRLYEDRNDIVNHIISECYKQKELTTRHDWVKEVIHWELCMRLDFYHTTKWYKHKLESVLEN